MRDNLYFAVMRNCIFLLLISLASFSLKAQFEEVIYGHLDTTATQHMRLNKVKLCKETQYRNNSDSVVSYKKYDTSGRLIYSWSGQLIQHVSYNEKGKVLSYADTVNDEDPTQPRTNSFALKYFPNGLIAYFYYSRANEEIRPTYSSKTNSITFSTKKWYVMPAVETDYYNNQGQHIRMVLDFSGNKKDPYYYEEHWQYDKQQRLSKHIARSSYASEMDSTTRFFVYNTQGKLILDSTVILRIKKESKDTVSEVSFKKWTYDKQGRIVYEEERAAYEISIHHYHYEDISPVEEKIVVINGLADSVGITLRQEYMPGKQRLPVRLRGENETVTWEYEFYE